MEIQTVLPTNPIKPIKIRHNDEQKKQQQQNSDDKDDTEHEQKDTFKQDSDDGVQHIDEIV